MMHHTSSPQILSIPSQESPMFYSQHAVFSHPDEASEKLENVVYPPSLATAIQEPTQFLSETASSPHLSPAQTFSSPKSQEEQHQHQQQQQQHHHQQQQQPFNPSASFQISVNTWTKLQTFIDSNSHFSTMDELLSTLMSTYESVHSIIPLPNVVPDQENCTFAASGDKVKWHQYGEPSGRKRMRASTKQGTILQSTPNKTQKKSKSSPQNRVVSSNSNGVLDSFLFNAVGRNLLSSIEQNKINPVNLTHSSLSLSSSSSSSCSPYAASQENSITGQSPYDQTHFVYETNNNTNTPTFVHPLPHNTMPVFHYDNTEHINMYGDFLLNNLIQ